MTNEEAKFILSAFRPNGMEHDNPRSGTPCAWPEPIPFCQWLERSRAYDSAVAGKLKQWRRPPRFARPSSPGPG